MLRFPGSSCLLFMFSIAIIITLTVSVICKSCSQNQDLFYFISCSFGPYTNTYDSFLFPSSISSIFFLLYNQIIHIKCPPSKSSAPIPLSFSLPLSSILHLTLSYVCIKPCLRFVKSVAFRVTIFQIHLLFIQIKRTALLESY